MKRSMTLGEVTIDDHGLGTWPEQPMEAISAYLKTTHPENRMWITQEESREGVARKFWYMVNDTFHRVGEPCASFTISEY